MIISLYAHGMTVRDILHHLNQVYGTQLSPEQVSAITDAVLEEVKAWQHRVLDPVWPVAFLDAIMVKVRDRLPVVGVIEVEAAACVPLRALVAVRRDAARVLEHAGMRARCSRFQVMKVVLRLVKSFSGPPEPGSR